MDELIVLREANIPDISLPHLSRHIKQAEDKIKDCDSRKILDPEFVRGKG
ncbi:hypothetical protein [Streptomyces mirabilis]